MGKSYLHAGFFFAVSLANDIYISKSLYEKITSLFENTEGCDYISINQRGNYEIEKDVITEDMSFCEKLDMKKELGDAISYHESMIMEIYNQLQKEATEKKENYYLLTKEESKVFFGKLQTIKYPHNLWSEDYYLSKMQQFFDILQGDTELGFYFNGKKRVLTQQQAEAVIWTLEEFLGFNTIFDVENVVLPKGSGFLEFEGSTFYCEKCYKHATESCNRNDCGIY